ncbi:carotenoid 1,2-hydratase [Massilia sp. G4R7]|uniref:Carotenoid 1,2-hydratase n=1 Tax=Massilia phyllostachyos TaxID=2898585 RepID=A0ABS8Q597_9BURK|nr:carotenoid 1,2-hydratase [Massilia phyllostachyos]MCD2516917.1 carotenoid 1,2-hydratase [Massilia phyllostachyos]
MNQMWMLALIGVAGVASTALYARRRQWIDALLVLVAAIALGLFAAGLKVPGDGGRVLALEPDQPAPVLDGVRGFSVKGDGLRAAQWNDLPALPLQWEQPKGGTMRLDFTRQLALGRTFTLRLQREEKAEARLQLLAENGQPIGEARGTGELKVDWMPPLAERMVLRARLLDKDGNKLAEGPVPVNVHAPAILHVQGRFGAPSFDLRTLNELLAGSGALLDWQVVLGRAINRTEVPREEMKEPNLLVVDAAWLERAGAGERSALLGRVAGGVPLLVLGSNANDPGFWSRALQLPLKAQPADAKTDAPLELAVAPFNPGAREAGPWRGSDNLVWIRGWQKGRIAWLGAAEWHRYAITDPQALALWWQSVLDRVGVERPQEVEWLEPDELPLPGQRMELCARGVSREVSFPELKLARSWAPRTDSACVAVWPQEAGWLRVADAKAGEHAVYVYSPEDWPQWQAAQRRDATTRYMARTPVKALEGAARAFPAWPFAVVFALAMLLLWWRERR